MTRSISRRMYSKVAIRGGSDTSSQKNYWSIGGATISKRAYRVEYQPTPILGQNQTFFGLTTSSNVIFSDYFVCDPFVIRFSNTTYLFFEICGYVETKYITAIAVTTIDTRTLALGDIHIIKVANDKKEKNRTFTISYPYPLVVGNDMFLVLEEFSQGANTQIYEFDAQSLTINPINQIEARLLDPNIQFHNDRYWVYGIDQNYAIRVFSSKSIYKKFMEHPTSGKYKSMSFARNAGSVFLFEGCMIRPFQNCSIEYGKKVAFSEITLDSRSGLTISKSNSLESLEISGSANNPYWISNKSHHFAFLGEDESKILCLVDGARNLRITNHAWSTIR